MASAAVLNGNRTTTFQSSTTSAIGLTTTRSGTNAEARDDSLDSSVRMRRQRSKFDLASP